MFRLTGSVRIAAPLETVFEYVSEWRNATKFLNGLKTFEPIDMDHQYGFGSRFKATIAAGPVNVQGVMEIIEHVENEKVTYKTIKGPRMTGSWDFRREGEVTVVDLTNDIELPGGPLGRIVERFAENEAHKDLDRSLQDLKLQLEGGP